VSVTPAFGLVARLVRLIDNMFQPKGYYWVRFTTEDRWKFGYLTGPTLVCYSEMWNKYYNPNRFQFGVAMPWLYWVKAVKSHPLTWPKWVRRIYILTLPLAVIIHLVALILAALLYLPVRWGGIPIQYLYMIWRGSYLSTRHH
jgi:hypothetical protein